MVHDTKAGVAAHEPARRRIRPQRAAELVAADIRGRILSGELDEGLPTETVLLADFSVSRPTLREALRILETEGLIRTRRGKQGGAVVSRPTVNSAAYHFGLVLQGAGVDLGDLAEARRQLEMLCVSLAARRPDRDRIAAELEALAAESEALVGDRAAFAASLRRFDERLVAACGNETLRTMVGTVERVGEIQQTDPAAAPAEDLGEPARREAVESRRRSARRIAAGEAELDGGVESTRPPPADPRVVDASLLR